MRLRRSLGSKSNEALLCSTTELPVGGSTAPQMSQNIGATAQDLTGERAGEMSGRDLLAMGEERVQKEGKWVPTGLEEKDLV